MIELLKAGIGEDGNGSALNRTPSHPLRRHIPVTRVSVQNVSLFSPYILYRAKHNHQSWIRLLFFFFFFFLVSQFFPHPSRYPSFVLRTRVPFSRDAQSRGGRGQHPSCRKSRVYYYDHMFMPRLYLGKGEGSMGGVHLLESYDTRLRGCTRGQSKQPTVGYVSLCKQKATYVVDLLE